MAATTERRPTGRPTRRRRGTLARVGVVLTLAVGGYVAVSAVQVWLAAVQDGARPAQAIIVLGAAQYDGRPSPALRERLDHAVTLYRDDVAPVLVVTGGRRPGDRFDEATASVTYLHAHGVPDQAIRREVHGTNTWEQVAASARFLRQEGIVDVVLVTHPWHARRVALVAAEAGLDATVSPIPAPTRRLLSSAGVRQGLRETAAVSTGRLVGFRRLTAWTRG